MRILKLSFIVFSLFYSLSVNAQGIPGVSSPIILDMSPTNPRSGDTVYFDLRSYSIDINSASITWYVDGKKIESGIGSKSFTAVAGKLGSITKIDVTALSGGQSYDASATIRPLEMTLFWEAGTYVPPFYKGKAMPTYGGVFRVIAIPEIIDKSGKIIATKDLVYKWKKNGVNQNDLSGYGKNTFVTSQSTFVRQGDEITVEVTSPNDDFSVTRSITVSSGAPSIIFYEKSPLYGMIYEKALENNFDLKNEELTVVAEPYFFSDVSVNGGALTKTWSLNGQNVAEFKDKNFITLRRVDESAGYSNIGLTIQNTIKLLQGANKNLNISYE